MVEAAARPGCVPTGQGSNPSPDCFFLSPTWGHLCQTVSFSTGRVLGELNAVSVLGSAACIGCYGQRVVLGLDL
jgi:hypothetical protein